MAEEIVTESRPESTQEELDTIRRLEEPIEEEVKTEEDSLDEMDYNELKLLAVKKGINPHFVKKDELIEKLKKLE